MARQKREHAQGPAQAGIVLIEYGDYECGDSGRAYQLVQDAQRQLGADMRFVFRHFPARDRHPRAQRAAEAAEAAAAQGRFWEMHDLLFAHQPALSDRHLREYAAALDLDLLRFDCELDARVHAERVREDRIKGVKDGVIIAPTFFINGVRYDGAGDLSKIIGALQPLVAA
jgi:protein-disulfide isomerase